MELIKRRGTLVVVSAPSGAGKTTLCHEVRQLVPDLFYSVSYTTRLPRAGEVDGKDFHFVSDAEFLDMRDKDEFAEWAEVHGNRYGTPVKALEGALVREVQHRVHQVPHRVVDIEREDPQADPDLGRGQPGPALVEQGLDQVLDQGAELLVEVDDRVGRRTQDGIAEESDRLDGHR